MLNVEECSVAYDILARLAFNVKGKVMHGFFFCCVNLSLERMWEMVVKMFLGKDLRGESSSVAYSNHLRWLLLLISVPHFQWGEVLENGEKGRRFWK